MNPTIRRARPVAVALLAIAALTGCTNYDPRTEDEASLPVPTPAPTQAPAATPAATAVVGGSIHVVMTVATDDAVTVDVADASSTLVSATSGTPGDGASVEAYKLVVTNVTPTTLRLTWLGGPCDSANSLSIDADRRRLLLVQPECGGDSIATDRILDLAFSTSVRAADMEAFLQDGLDT